MTEDAAPRDAAPSNPAPSNAEPSNGAPPNAAPPNAAFWDAELQEAAPRGAVSQAARRPVAATGGGPDLAVDPLAVDPLALDRQVCFALSVASRLVIGVYRPLLEPLGLTHPQYLVMLALWERSPRSVKDLGAALMLDSATLSPLLKRLEAAGYLSRRRAAADERLLTLELTASGRDLRREALKIPYAVVDRLGVELADLQDLHGALTTIIEAARTAGTD